MSWSVPTLTQLGLRRQVIDSVRDRLAEIGVGEVVSADPDRNALAMPLTSGVLVVPDQLLLFRVDAHHRVSHGLELLGLLVDIAELRIPVGMLCTFNGLGVALQAEALLAQQDGDRVRRDPVALPGQIFGQLPGRLHRPSQRRHRIPAHVRLDQRQQRGPQPRIQVHRPLATPAHPADPPQRRLPGLQFSYPARDGALTHPGRTGDKPDPAVSQRPRLRPYDQPTLALVQVREQRLELRRQHRIGPLRNPHTTTTRHDPGSDGLFPGKP